MRKIKNNFYILTGGPGSGKTSIIETLREIGYDCVPEVGRKIIKEQITLNGDALPWSDTEKYSNLMLSYSIQDYMNLFEPLPNFHHIALAVVRHFHHGGIAHKHLLPAVFKHAPRVALYKLRPALHIIKPAQCLCN